MYYNIENSCNKLHITPLPKVEVKKEGNITEVKMKEDGNHHPQGGSTEIREGIPENGHK